MKTTKKKRTFFKLLFPETHGISSSLFEEYIRFGEKKWIKKFIQQDIIVEKIIRLPYYHGYGYQLTPIIKLGNLLGLSSSTAYICRKLVLE